MSKRKAKADLSSIEKISTSSKKQQVDTTASKPKSALKQKGKLKVPYTMKDYVPFKGIMAASFTPFKDEKCTIIDYDQIKAYAKDLVSQGVNGLFLNGTAGESVSLSVSERKKLLEAWMSTEEVQSEQLYVIAHIGCEAFPDVVELSKHARDHGAKGICVMNTSYFKPTSPQHLGKFIADVANEVPDSPFYYYYFPSNSGVRINVKDSLDFAKKLAPNVVGCKYTDSDLGDVGLIANAGYTCLLGADTMVLPGLVAGAQGAIGIGFNIMGSLFRSLYDNYQKGDIKKADQLQQTAREVFDIIKKNGLFTSCKAIFQEWRGFNMGNLRWPQLNYTKAEREKVIKEMKPYRNKV